MQQLPVVGAALMFALAACADPVSNRGAPEGEGVLATALANGASNGVDHSSHSNNHIAVLDACDPTDPGWTATGGCTLAGGTVTVDEFDRLLFSPLSLSTVGHPAWRMEPAYALIAGGGPLDVTNDGGRFHTFTPVAQFGGGRVPPLNQGLTMAPECALPPGGVDPWGLLPGGSLQITNLRPGNNRYMCCIHPWMRALVKVPRV